MEGGIMEKARKKAMVVEGNGGGYLCFVYLSKKRIFMAAPADQSAMSHFRTYWLLD